MGPQVTVGLSAVWVPSESGLGAEQRAGGRLRGRPEDSAGHGLLWASSPAHSLWPRARLCHWGLRTPEVLGMKEAEEMAHTPKWLPEFCHHTRALHHQTSAYTFKGSTLLGTFFFRTRD